MMVTMSLVRWLGARRARVAAQVLAALIGAGFFIVSQLPNYLSQQKNNVIVAWFKRELDGDGWLSPGSVLWWPARAMTGEWLPLVIVMIVSFGGFWAVVNLTYRRFVTGTQESVTAGRTAHRTSLEPIRFQGGFARMLLLKEWRTIWRDPQIISQTLLQLLYLFPMLFLGFSGRQSSWVLIPGLVMMGSMLAGNLAWLTIAAEDAPELVGTAPVSIDRVRFLKAVAAVAPVMALLLPLALWWSFRDPYLACVLLLCTVGGASSAALCQIWNPRQGNRRDLKLRYRQNRLVNVLESLGAMGWAGVAFCLNGHVLWLPVPLFFVTLGPGSAWLLGHRARRSGALA
jgi:ABC-2 type transport system permease protein